MDAAKALASLFTQLEAAPEDKRVYAALHLARAFGQVDASPAHSSEAGVSESELRGWRSVREVITFLRARGAKFRSLEARIEGDWAALSSDGEGYDSESVSLSERDDVTWVPPARH